MSDDPWVGESSTTSDASYNVDKFYTASRNAKGFGTTIRITVSPQLLAEVGAMVASRQIPEYRVSADFFRDAIVHRLHWLQDQIVAEEGFSPSNLSKMLRANEQAERHAMMREARDTYLKLVGNNLRAATSEMERRKIVEEIAQTAREIDDPYLRNELQRFIV